MKSKKLTSLVLAGAMCAGMLAGCGDKETPETQPTTAPVDFNFIYNPGTPSKSGFRDISEKGAALGIPSVCLIPLLHFTRP